MSCQFERLEILLLIAFCCGVDIRRDSKPKSRHRSYRNKTFIRIAFAMSCWYEWSSMWWWCLCLEMCSLTWVNQSQLKFPQHRGHWDKEWNRKNITAILESWIDTIQAHVIACPLSGARLRMRLMEMRQTSESGRKAVIQQYFNNNIPFFFINILLTSLRKDLARSMRNKLQAHVTFEGRILFSGPDKRSVSS